MNEQNLSKRLQKVAEFVPQGARVADIGSDHAYLPAWLVLHNRINFAVAGEVVRGPYESAQNLVAQLSLGEYIDVRLADGLEVLADEEEITAITIAGMGGTLISEILERGFQKKKLTGNERLILQPNVGEKALRVWLMKYNYTILSEAILQEDEKIYEIIVAEKTNKKVSYSEKELIFGPHLLRQKSEVFLEKWQKELQQKERVLVQLKQAKTQQEKKIKELSHLIEWIKEVLK